LEDATSIKVTHLEAWKGEE